MILLSLNGSYQLLHCLLCLEVGEERMKMRFTDAGEREPVKRTYVGGKHHYAAFTNFLEKQRELQARQ